MKKIFLLLCAFLAVRQLAVCQNTFGVKAGLNLSSQHLTSTGPKVVQPTSLLAYRFGVYFKRKLSEKWSITSEVNYSLVGSRELFANIDTTQTAGLVSNRYSNKIGYLEIPLGIQYNLGDFYLGVGPSVAFKIYSQSSAMANTHYYRTPNVSGNILAGQKVSKNVDLNISYSYGLVNTLSDQSKYGGGYYIAEKSRCLNLSILYSIQ